VGCVVAEELEVRVVESTVGVVKNAVFCENAAPLVVAAPLVERPLRDPVVVVLYVIPVFWEVTDVDASGAGVASSVHAQTALTDAVLLMTPSLLNKSCPPMSL